MTQGTRTALACALAAALVTGCIAQADPSVAGASPGVPSGTPPATVRPTPVPGEPGATLRIGDGAPIAGALGSWTGEVSGSDAPWLPASALTPIDLAADGVLSIAFADGTLVGSFAASVADVADVRGESPHRVGGRGSAIPPLAAVPVGPLPRGAWVLAVQLVRADERGEATFYWSVRVP